MTLSLEDIMAFMQQDKIERKSDREADLEFFRKYILKGVQEQVEVAIKPMQEKQSKLEQEQVVMENRFQIFYRKWRSSKIPSMKKTSQT